MRRYQLYFSKREHICFNADRESDRVVFGNFAPRGNIFPPYLTQTPKKAIS